MNSSKISQLQLLQQNLQNILVQKQQLQSQAAEVDSALEGLQNTEKAYKIMGHIMIASSREELSQDLQERKETFSLRLKNFITQEEKLKKNIEQVQQEVLGEFGSKKNG